jgi:superfamily II DNA/RNA helicase
MVLERNNIFDGADIITGNPRRILDLYIQNGIHVGQLTLFVVDDASEIAKDAQTVQRILRLAESLPKCQKILLSKEWTPRVEQLADQLCVRPLIREFEQPAAQ